MPSATTAVLSVLATIGPASPELLGRALEIDEVVVLAAAMPAARRGWILADGDGRCRIAGEAPAEVLAAAVPDGLRASWLRAADDAERRAS